MAVANKGPKKRTKQLNISTIISGDGRPIRLGRLQEESRSSSAGPGSPVDTQGDTGEDGQEAGWLLTFEDILRPVMLQTVTYHLLLVA